MALKKPEAPAKAKRTLSTFKSLHDPSVIIPAKIKAALERLKREEGAEAFAYEQTDPHGGVPMVKRADVSTMHLSSHRKLFAPHIVKVRQDTGSRRGPKFVWFADPKVATEARGGPVNLDDFE